MTEDGGLELNIDDDSESNKQTQLYSLRDGVIFIIDATEPMFELDPDTDISYFSQCLETYKNILSEKLSWNKTDWMGIILMGTANKWDQDPEIKNVYTWQPFKMASIDQLIEVEKALANVDKFHNEIGSSTSYPLFKALLHASRCLNDVKIKMPYRHIVILTRADNPYADDAKERYRIKQKVQDCNTMKIQLSVVGFGKEWNPDNFFEEFESFSGKFKEAEDYQRTFLADLEEQVKHASKITNKLVWKLGEEVKLGVSISTIIAKTKFPKQIKLKKENNEPLDAYSYLRKAGSDSTDEEDEDEDGEENVAEKVVLSRNVYRCAEYGGRNIKFSLQEAQSLWGSRKPGITLVGYETLSKLDVSCHLEAPKFVICDESEIRGSENLFSALLMKCEEKNVMAICVVTFREKSASYLHAMIPNMAHGGFYAYKLPFAENIRNLSSVLLEYCYNETDNVCPINEDTSDLCEKFIKKSSFAYNPTMFPNPKLHFELAGIEGLALNRESRKTPTDFTIPDKEDVSQRLGDLKFRLQETVHKDKNIKRIRESFSEASGKVRKVDEEIDFKELVQDENVDKCTVKQLRDYLKSVGKNPVGKKEDLVRMVYTLFNKA